MTSPTMHFIICGDGNIQWTAERTGTDMDRQSTVDDIARLQVSDVIDVIAVDLTAGTAKSIMQEIASEVHDRWMAEADRHNEEPCAEKIAFIEAHIRTYVRRAA